VILTGCHTTPSRTATPHDARAVNLPSAGAAAVVADLLRLLANTRSALGTTGLPWQGQRDAYLRWVEDAERRLRGLSDDGPAVALHTERYWKIRELTSASVRPAGLVQAEIDAQHARLSAVAAGLPAPPTGPGGEAAPGVRAVFDTNVHLHFPRFDQHDWAGELGGPVVVVVPLVVLEELDRHKNQGKPVLGDRAGRVAKEIEDLVEEHAGRVDDRLSVVLALETDGHVRRPTVDAEIVAVAAALAGGPGPRVVVVTDDAGLRTRARARGLTVHRPRAERLPSTDPAAARLRKDQQEVDGILAARPDAKVTFADGDARLLPPPPAPQPTTQDGFVASVVNGAGQDRPALDVPGPPPGLLGISSRNWESVTNAGANRRYNEQRDAWLRALADWSGKEYERLVRERNAVDLNLCGRNSGGAAAQDVEVRVELPEGDRSVYLRADSVEAAEDRPQPPEHSPNGINLAGMISPVRSRLDVRPTWRWQVNAEARTAVLHVDRVLQGDLPRPFGPTLLLVPRTGTFVRPVSLRWSLTGANPSYLRTGTLTVMPGKQVREG